MHGVGQHLPGTDICHWSVIRHQVFVVHLWGKGRLGQSLWGRTAPQCYGLKFTNKDHQQRGAPAQELSALWEGLLGALEAGRLPDLARAVLAFAYTWYNFMPLARGTAAAGYVAILGLFAAAGMPVSTPCPKVPRACLVPCAGGRIKGLR